MNLLDHISPFQPDIETRPGETVYRWGEVLAVIVMDDGEVGQFASTAVCTRAEVEEVVAVTHTVKMDD